MDDIAEKLVRRATAAFNSGRPDEAQKLCEQGLARDPGDPMLHHLLAAVLFSRSEIASAHAHIEASLAKRPGNAAARLLAARIARSEGNFDVALAHIDSAIATSPQREIFVEKARTLDQAGLRAQARESWRAILKVIPGHQEAAARLGRLAWEDGDPATAAGLLEQATATDAPASVWFDLGLARQDLRDYSGAASAYRKAFDIKPDHAEAALNLGIALQEGGDLDDAMHAFAQAYRLRPQLFGSIAMALTSASHGRLWLDEDGLRRALGS
ncbi:tetratricopeptide (TPR) repeat protein [Bradyrhizobium sp. F1.4.3]|uniref:tetratricopeptide repeat protein n=1 Tax=Bradyrhizobium sp. F1.4.3 TaxID=3156356 RepID=UPI0033946ED2